MPNPWLRHPQHHSRDPVPATDASFVEYLRWMRILRDNPTKDSQISLLNAGEVLQLFELLTQADYQKPLKRLSDRLAALADLSLDVQAPWRIRVGGIRGPESMLLPAFDALGLPYIPSSSLKGVARAVAVRSGADADQIHRLFGTIDAPVTMGCVIFLDAYPLPTHRPFQERHNDDIGDNSAVGLVPDTATSIWTWDTTTKPPTPTYRPNPNPFLSLRQVTIRIGLRKGQACTDADLEQVKKWLLQGLGEGIGAQVNTGYGVLQHSDTPDLGNPIYKLAFTLKGQLIHGRQAFDQWTQKDNSDEWKTPGQAQAEVRPTAFRSMLRYWFRAFSLGVLPPATVQQWEEILFGGISNTPHTGLVQLQIFDAKIVRDNATGQGDDEGLATGKLIVRRSPLFKQLTRGYGKEKRSAVKKLMANLTWLMANLGGVGQGARRPCYSRQNRPQHRLQPPYWRGSTLTLHYRNQNNDRQRNFWRSPSTTNDPQRMIHSHIQWFYTALSTLVDQEISGQSPITSPVHPSSDWIDAVDRHCQIVCVRGDWQQEKPPALAVLHHLATQNGNGYDRQLCGSMGERSPIWIADVGENREGLNYNIVTVFGCNNALRQEYLTALKNQTYPVHDYYPIFPFD